ncbi:MAG: NarL family two-component response regulator [Anaerolineaceae bacterium]|nr:MAG: NarL family two-component response regulator [Anaerolineaceae bacterium]
MTKIRVLLVDDHHIVRMGLKTIINDQPGMEVVGEAGNAAEALREVERLQPDVVLMDIRLPGQSGIEAAGQISKRFPHSKVVMLTSFADDSMIFRAISAGAVGYVLKQVEDKELLRAITVAAQGEAVLDPSVTSRLIARVREAERKSDEDAFRDLSGRELDVLNLVAKGKTNPEIAESLNLSSRTAGNYVSTILQKLHLTNRIELATYAVEHHLSDRMTKE